MKWPHTPQHTHGGGNRSQPYKYARLGVVYRNDPLMDRPAGLDQRKWGNLRIVDVMRDERHEQRMSK